MNVAKQIDLVDSSSNLNDSAQLVSMLDKNGYLYLPGLLPVGLIADLQRQVGIVARADGWLRADMPVELALADPAGFCVDLDQKYLKLLRKFNLLQDYHALKHHPVLIFHSMTVHAGVPNRRRQLRMSTDALKFYWRRLPLNLRRFDRVWFDRRDALGFERGEAGDPRARSVLQRIVARDPDPVKQARAQALLDRLPADS